MKYVLVAVIASLITVFALQNTEPASLTFLFWTIDSVPLAGVILASFAAGVVVAGLPLTIDRWRLAARVRRLEGRVAAADNERALRAAPPRTPPARSAGGAP
jgi:uncharacterized integral membrane protein